MIENIYYMVFAVIPTKQNQQYEKVNDVSVSCWIKSTDCQSAYMEATFSIEKYDWIIEKNIQEPIEVIEENFLEQEIGLEYFHIAQEKKKSFVYMADPKDGIARDSIKLKPSYKFDMSKYLLKSKELANEGRCLHYQSGDRCDEIIKAHSIQKNRVLSTIDRNGKVYYLSTNMNDMRKNDGNFSFKEDGINKFSIFKGFCKYHDNKLFEPIDNSDFTSENKQHIFLYAYRSLAKELFEKENSLNLHIATLEDVKETRGLNNHFSILRDGARNGYNSLIAHKTIYDDILNNESYNDMRYVSFNSSDTLFMAFSSVFYPDYDFMGNLLQDLSNTSKTFDLISFYSVPTEIGWSFIFSWHKSSNNVCLAFIHSLNMIIREGNSLGDLLFQFVISSCVNFAFSPSWWESLPKNSQTKISQSITNMASPTTMIRENYLMNELTGISNWDFKTVNDNLN